MGHTRLSIIGLGDVGAQPFTTPEGDCLSYNGEIYNYKELAARLGIEANSDSRVLLEILRRDKLEMLESVRGMFAFVFYSSRRDTILAGRDHFGIKPLYRLDHPDGNLSFASTAAALTAHPDSKEVNDNALIHFATMGFFPSLTSPYRNIKKLQPGVLYEHRNAQGSWVEWATKKINAQTGSALSVGEALSDSLSKHMISDVEVGVLMSGGVDSTLIAALASQENQGLRTYTITNPDNREIDESVFASLNARALGANHTEVPVTPGLLAKELEPLIRSCGEPISDAAYLPLSVLTKRVEQDVKVVLAGEGADELFGGYRRYTVEAKRSKSLSGRALRLGTRAVRPLSHSLPPSSPYARAIKCLTRSDPYLAHADLLGGDWHLALKTFGIEAFPAARMGTSTWRDSQQTQADPEIPSPRQFDLRQWLPNVFLEKSDRASMHNSVEVRVPFLDAEVAAAASSQPPNSRDTSKQPLREVLRSVLPQVTLPQSKMGLAVDEALVNRPEIRQYREYVYHDPESRLRQLAGNTREAGQLLQRFDPFVVACIGIWETSFAS